MRKGMVGAPASRPAIDGPGTIGDDGYPGTGRSLRTRHPARPDRQSRRRITTHSTGCRTRRSGCRKRDMKFRVVGPFVGSVQGKPSTPSAARVRWTLALLLRANHVVDQGCIIQELWGESPPRSAVTTTQTYLYQLRKKYLRFPDYLDEGEFIETRPPDHLLWCDESEIDVFADPAAEHGRRSRLRQRLALGAARCSPTSRRHDTYPPHSADRGAPGRPAPVPGRPSTRPAPLAHSRAAVRRAGESVRQVAPRAADDRPEQGRPSCGSPGRLPRTAAHVGPEPGHRTVAHTPAAPA